MAIMPHSTNSRDWSFTIRRFNDIPRTLMLRRLTTLQRKVGVFYRTERAVHNSWSFNIKTHLSSELYLKFLFIKQEIWLKNSNKLFKFSKTMFLFFSFNLESVSKVILNEIAVQITWGFRSTELVIIYRKFTIDILISTWLGWSILISVGLNTCSIFLKKRLLETVLTICHVIHFLTSN